MIVSKKQLTLSQAAVDRLKHILLSKPKGTFLRVEVVAGGCHGFNIQFKLDHVINDDDIVANTYDEIKVVADETTLELINGSSVEFNNSLMGQYFWLNVTNAKSKCSCGSSFSL